MVMICRLQTIENNLRRAREEASKKGLDTNRSYICSMGVGGRGQNDGMDELMCTNVMCRFRGGYEYRESVKYGIRTVLKDFIEIAKGFEGCADGKMPSEPVKSVKSD